jgi:hypothetical protein
MQRSPQHPRRRPRQPLSRDLAATIQPMKEAAARLKQRVGRFGLYDFLEAVYSTYGAWKRQKAAKRLARALARELNIALRSGMSPIRILIEAAFPNADFKQKSRWVRALEYIYSENVLPSRFPEFIRSRGGIAGCARLAVNANRKRRRPGGDWND